MNQRFPIGTKYTTTRNRIRREHTVIDVHKTYNAAGEMVRLRYVASHPFLNQTLIDYDVADPTIAMNNPILPEVKP